MFKLIPVILLVFFSFTGKAQINMVIKQDGFLFMQGKDSIFYYQKIAKDKNGEYARCNYIYPLYGPDGSRLTADFQANYPHDRGIFWAWYQVLINNKPISDGWGFRNFQQKVTGVEFMLKNGNGLLNTTTEWKSPLWEKGVKAYLKEETKITIHPKTENFRRIDFEIRLKALTDRLSIGGSDDEKGIGGFSSRLKLPADVLFTGQKGTVDPADKAIDAGNAINVSGSFLDGGKQGGVVIWSDPSNPEPSPRWILRKADGIQNPAFPGRKPVAIPFGQPLVLKYSLLVYQEILTQKQVRKAMKH
jgi:hypothetical protein